MSVPDTETVKVTNVRRGEQDQAEQVSTDVRERVTKDQDTLEPQIVARIVARKPIQSSVKNSTKLLIKPNSRDVIGQVIYCLAIVEKHMSSLQDYVKIQEGAGKPLYQWSKYGKYIALSRAVSELEEATKKFSLVQLPQDYATRIASATSFSASVSKSAIYVYAAVSKKTGDHVHELEGSILSDIAKMHANALIMEETGRLLEHCTRATEHVWRATDLLRTYDQQIQKKDWAWSAAATAMIAFIAATVAIVAAHLYGPPGLGLAPKADLDNGRHAQTLAIIQQTQAVTNLTDELYSVKLQNVDQRYKDLVALSESHGLRIDNLVESLGPPNQEGTYYLSTDTESCAVQLQKASDSLKIQLQRQQQELESLRKNVLRMDVRLTRSVEKSCKH